MRDLITIVEQFFTAFTTSSKDYVEVFKNPSRQEFEKVRNDHDGHGGVRGFLDGTDLYIFDSYLATHYDADEGAGIWGQRIDWGGPINPNDMLIYWNWDYENENYPDFEGSFDNVREWLLQLPCLIRLGYNWRIRPGLIGVGMR